MYFVKISETSSSFDQILTFIKNLIFSQRTAGQNAGNRQSDNAGFIIQSATILSTKTGVRGQNKKVELIITI